MGQGEYTSSVYMLGPQNFSCFKKIIFVAILSKAQDWLVSHRKPKPLWNPILGNHLLLYISIALSVANLSSCFLKLLTTEEWWSISTSSK